MALLNNNLKVKDEPLPGQGRSLGRPINPDWVGGLQAGTDTKTDHIERYKQNKAGNDPAYQAFMDKVLGPLGLGNNSKEATKPPGANNYLDIERQAQAGANQAIRNARASSRRQSNGQRKPLPVKTLLGGDIKDKITATRVTLANATWLGYAWLAQLVLGILMILSFAVMASVDYIIAADKTSSSTGILNWIATKTISLVGSVTDSILKFVGIDFAEIAVSVGTGSYLIITGIGLLSLMIIFFQYIWYGFKPISGQGSGLKFGTFLLAYIGCLVPFLNLIPFTGLWMAAVMYHPK